MPTTTTRTAPDTHSPAKTGNLQSPPPSGPCEPTALDRHYDVVVIGGGQAGLAVGYFLRQRGVRFVILDAATRVGDAWRKRWDSLRLFTPAKFNGLPGLPFPAPANTFPTKDQMGDYLETYASVHGLPVCSGTRVTRLSRTADGRFALCTARGELHADQVIVAMAGYQKPRIPSFAAELSDRIVQLHASGYRRPSQLRPGDVLIVGAGNSGAEIAKELCNDHRVFLSGPDVGQVPFAIGGWLGRVLLARLLLRVVFHRVLTIRTRPGRAAHAALTRGSGPLIRVKSRHLRDLGVTRVARTVGVAQGQPLLSDGRTLDVSNVVWCSGYEPGLEWIDLPIVADDGKPKHDGGLVPDAPGLYFVGQHFLYALSSAMVHGVGRDASRIVEALLRQRDLNQRAQVQ